MGECRDVNETRYYSGKLVLLSDSEIKALRIYGPWNELWNRGIN